MYLLIYSLLWSSTHPVLLPIFPFFTVYCRLLRIFSLSCLLIYAKYSPIYPSNDSVNLLSNYLISLNTAYSFNIFTYSLSFYESSSYLLIYFLVPVVNLLLTSDIFSHPLTYFTFLVYSYSLIYTISCSYIQIITIFIHR